VREIGKALNVATILEGSVRREGQRVRIKVQLIDASNDKQMWAQVYDRELNDVFAIVRNHNSRASTRSRLGPASTRSAFSANAEEIRWQILVDGDEA
jgi:adenylate cyclase